eukprot:TRINITY_DN62325_c0_g1_i1.p1 TRINITY_DN62325_c0_g1~~TRINITY_DN62325_c0_g1_i1.p1  ORF type:complete len:557 (-),score=100.56 TRINITY_DN62325_c0_g1_i1:46-1632(-)
MHLASMKQGSTTGDPSSTLKKRGSRATLRGSFLARGLELPVEDQLWNYTGSFRQNQDPEATFTEQLEELKQLSEQDMGISVHGFMESVRQFKKEPPMQIEDMLQNLTTQKATQRRHEAVERKKYEHKARMLKSASAPAVAEQKPQQVSSAMPGSASFSFGPGFSKPQTHLRGHLKIPVLQPRDSEYVFVPGGGPVPGPGAYTLPSTTLLEAEERGGGYTGGWSYADHKVFMDEFKKSGRKATRTFFKHVYHELPDIPPLTIIDHVHWLADFDTYLAKKQRRVDNFAYEREAVSPKKTQKPPTLEETQQMILTMRKEMAGEKQKAQELHEMAAAEEKFIGHSRHAKKSEFEAHQRFEGQVLEGNLRGNHPGFKKSPGYTWAHSREMRDLREKKKTSLSHVRSSSHHDNPGPGQYLGLEPEHPIALRTAPSWTMRKRVGGLPKVDPSAVTGPGYAGDLDAWEALTKELKVTQFEKPTWTFGKEAGHKDAGYPSRALYGSNEMYAIIDKYSTPPEVGPGKYEHASCMVSQF